MDSVILETRLLSPRTPRPVPIGDLFCDHHLLSECLGEAIDVGDRAQIDQLNARLDAIDAELARRSESEASAFEAQRWMREKGR